MNLGYDMHEALLTEMDFALAGMKETDQPAEKLYYLSAVFGAVQRTLNIQYDDELVYIHQVVLQAYQQILGRLNMMRQGQETPVILSPSLFVKVEGAVEELRRTIANHEAPDAPLKQLAVLGYSTTGNGFYLQIKGQLVL